LYYRLAEIVVPIPPLRERSGDAALLAHAFVHKFAEEQKRGSMTLGEDAIRCIENHRWPGNVRELENCVKRAVIMADGSRITREDIGLDVQDEQEPEFIDLRKVRDEAERQAIVTALGRANNNLMKTAEILGISRPTLYDLMHRLGLKSQNT
jgi:two-component system NtrC family response regulator